MQHISYSLLYRAWSWIFLDFPRVSIFLDYSVRSEHSICSIIKFNGANKGRRRVYKPTSAEQISNGKHNGMENIAANFRENGERMSRIAKRTNSWSHALVLLSTSVPRALIFLSVETSEKYLGSRRGLPLTYTTLGVSGNGDVDSYHLDSPQSWLILIYRKSCRSLWETATRCSRAPVVPSVNA